MDKALESYLKEHKIEYVEHKHKAVFTVAESTSIKKHIPGLSCKCLFLKDEKGKFYLLAMNAHKRANMKLLRKEIDVEKLHFASEEELKRELNVTPGSVSIFAMIHSKNVSLIIDKEVWTAEIVGFHPNINTSTLEISHKNLEIFINSLKTKALILKMQDE